MRGEGRWLRDRRLWMSRVFIRGWRNNNVRNIGSAILYYESGKEQENAIQRCLYIRHSGP